MILHPPEINAVRSVSERASVLLNTLAGFSPLLGAEYLARRKSLENFCSQTNDELLSLAEKYGADVIVLPYRCRKELGKLEGWRRVNSNWLVIRDW